MGCCWFLKKKKKQQKEGLNEIVFPPSYIIQDIRPICIKKKFRFQLIRGDLTKQNSEVIVNAANDQLILGDGVAGAIMRTFGSSVQEKCNEIALKLGQENRFIKNGEVFSHEIDKKFTGGLDNLKFIFHAVGPIYCGGKQGEEKELKNCFFNSLNKANIMKISSISIPPISSGIFGYPKKEVANIFFEVIGNYFLECLSDKCSVTLEEINMVIIDKETFEIFKEELKKSIFNEIKNENFSIEVFEN